MASTVRFNIPFEVLIEAVTSLDVQQQRRLLEVLEDLLFELEEDTLEHDPQVIAEIEEARNAYNAGDYQTIQEYISKQPHTPS